MASSRIQTWVHSNKFLCTNEDFVLWWLVGVDLMFLMWILCCSRNFSGSAGKSSSVKNSPGIRRFVPYKSSADEVFRSSLKHERNPRRAVNRDSVQFLDWWHIIEVLTVLCHLSKMPFEAGWYAEVRILLQPIKFVRVLKRADSNCEPWSVVIVIGDPYLATS